MLLFVASFIGFLILFLFIVGIHELGHFLAAKWLNVRVASVSLGFGKPILSYQNKEGVDFHLSRWPIGGYTEFLEEKPTKARKQKGYLWKESSFGSKIIILLSGVLFNILLFLAAMTIFAMLSHSLRDLVVKTVVPNSHAAMAGLQKGDQFISINGKKVDSIQDASMFLLESLGKTDVSCWVVHKNRAKREIFLNLKSLVFEKKDFFKAIGFTPDLTENAKKMVSPLSFTDAFFKACFELKKWYVFFLSLLIGLFSFTIPLSLIGGPLSMFVMSGKALLSGWSFFLFFVGMMSLAVSFVNILPLPGLDGGAIFESILQTGFNITFSPAFLTLLRQLLLIFFAVILVTLFMNDLERYLGVLAIQHTSTRSAPCNFN